MTTNELRRGIREALSMLMVGRVPAAMQVLRELAEDDEIKTQQVIATVCEELGVTAKEFEESQRRWVSEARWIVCAILHGRFGLSKTEVGKRIGVDHGAVIYGIRKIYEAPKYDRSLATKYQRFERRFE